MSLKLKLKSKEKDNNENFESSEQYQNLIEQMEIDKDNLDEEAKNHPNLMAKIGSILARKIHIETLEELKLDVVCDELFLDVKDNPENWNITSKKGEKEYRLTDTFVNRTIKKHPRYQKQFKRYLQAKIERKEFEGLFKSCEQRGWQISNLFQMWDKKYYDKITVREKNNLNTREGR